MFILFCAVLAVVLWLHRRGGGPIVVTAFAWLFAAAPLAFGLVRYQYFEDPDIGYELTLLGFIGCFYVGALVAQRRSRVPEGLQRSRAALREPVEARLPMAMICWWIGMFATLFLWLDWTTKGFSLGNLAGVRADFVLKTTGSSLLLQLATISSWACLYCYIFALCYRHQLSPMRFAYFVLPAGGYFLGSLLSAGRQAAFQLLFVSILVYAFGPVAGANAGKAQPNMRPVGRIPRSPIRRMPRGVLFGVAVSGALVIYMGYIAVARNDNQISGDHAAVLRYLFAYDVSPILNAIETALGQNAKAFIEETITYFTAPIPLFRSFLHIEAPHLYFGVFTFPFIMRQLEIVTHLSVIGSLYEKIGAMNQMGVIGAGWTTAISAYLWDFGLVGGCLFLAISGYYSERMWYLARTRGRFHDVVIAIMLMLSAVYMPMFPASSETGLLLVFMFCWFADIVSRLRR